MSDQNVEQPAEGVKTRGQLIARRSLKVDDRENGSTVYFEEKSGGLTLAMGVSYETAKAFADKLCDNVLAPMIDAACDEAVAEAERKAGVEADNWMKENRKSVISSVTPAQPSFHAALLDKFPSFDPSWSPEQQLAWFSAYHRLLRMGSPDPSPNIEPVRCSAPMAPDPAHVDPELAAIVAANTERLKNAPKPPVDMKPLDTRGMPANVRKSPYGISFGG